MNPLELAPLFFLDDAAFRARFRHTPLWRAKRRGLLRNAAIVLGNRPAMTALPALLKGLKDQEPLVREACAWALAAYPREIVRTELENHRNMETEPAVRRSVQTSLNALTVQPSQSAVSSTSDEG